MPRIRDDYLDCVFYLYPSERAARNGDHAGGTGFFVTAPIDVPWPGEDPSWHSIYAVTNAHVVNDGNLVVRTNTRDGKVDIVSTRDKDWVRDPKGADFAIRTGGPLTTTHPFHAIDLEQFAGRRIIEGWDVGPGDDVFFVGRFVNHEGKQKNLPSVRFGNISMMPGEPIKVRGLRAQESYLVEARSIPGYSGSPVFVYNISHRTNDDPIPHLHSRGRTLRNLQALPGMTYLLGIDWCHMYDRHHVEREDKPGAFSEAPGNIWARQNTMMMGVIPSYLIAEYLMSDEVRAMRNKKGQHVYSDNTRAGASLDSAPPSKAQKGITRDEFGQALKRASRKLPPSESGPRKRDTSRTDK